ncbi:hypothetical protein NDN13_01290 [Acinetobacter sp. C32I]|uniref:hypothetical protein n=1 Tax=Acinetobacter sp. C32I TaxID=2950074 RepID=UPI002037097F|nr:hypothetical protein [Acinetobacter sp. C32I]USA53854.1 hypothetical protein NDN13_01290 [Acinetobacter sp. C32I]
MKIGICKLCDKESELQNSHVIGKAVFRAMMKSSNSHYLIATSVNENIIKKSNDQFATPMLCRDCESLLNAKYENYSYWVLKNKQPGVKIHKKSDYWQFKDVNQYRLAMYVVSIFWRSMVSEHVVFKNSVLSEELSNYFKNCINGKIKIDEKFFNVKISKLYCNRGYYKERILENFILPPTLRVNHKSGFSYSMVFGGYYFEFFCGCLNSNERLEVGFIKTNKRFLKIPFKNFLSIPEVLKSLKVTREMYDRDKELYKNLLNS